MLFVNVNWLLGVDEWLSAVCIMLTFTVLVGYYMISLNISFDVGPNFFCPDHTQFYIMQCLTHIQLLCCSRTDCMNNLALLYFFISLAQGIHIFPGQMLIISFTDRLTSFASSMEEQIIAVSCLWI
jgi:hypothetical protein